jgi:hypothetical protein
MPFDSLIAADWSPATCLFLGVHLAVGVLLVWSTVAGRDLWPFSHYPMFARYENVAGVRVLRLRLHFADGRTADLADYAPNLAEETAGFFEPTDAGKLQPDTALRSWLGPFWTRACRQDPRLTAVVRVDAVVRAALIARAGALTVVEKDVLAVDPRAPAGTAAP